MERFSELEQKVRLIVQKNQQLNARLAEATAEIAQLKASRDQFESLLLQETATITRLNEERTSIRTSIDELLGSIAELERAEQTEHLVS